MILTGRGFDFVYAQDGQRDTINCNGQSDYRIIYDRRTDNLVGCPGANTDADSASAAGSVRTKDMGNGVTAVANNK